MIEILCPYTEDISFKSDDSEHCHCLKILSLSYKLPRHSTVCTNREKGEMDISSASGHQWASFSRYNVWIGWVETREHGRRRSVFNCVCLSSPTPPPAALQAQPTTLKWDLTILFHKISKTNTSWLSRFYWMLNMSSSFISEKEKVVTLPESLRWFYFLFHSDALLYQLDFEGWMPLHSWNDLCWLQVALKDRVGLIGISA